MMELHHLFQSATQFLLTNPHNFIQPQDAIREDLVGMQIYEAPVFGVGAASDSLFEELKNPQAVHPNYKLPDQWLAGAHSVISFFLPFSKQVKASNVIDVSHPSDEQLHARIEGENMLNLLRIYIRDSLIDAGCPSVSPILDPRFQMLARFASNQSERHTAYICGVGTFGLSKSLITKKGSAGRIGSVITAFALPVTPRPYITLYEYCTMCGRCAINCPVDCIDPSRGIERGKDHIPCSNFQDDILALPPRGQSQRMRYGCGKCQVKVPCQNSIPLRNKKTGL